LQINFGGDCRERTLNDGRRSRSLRGLLHSRARLFGVPVALGGRGRSRPDDVQPVFLGHEEAPHAGAAVDAAPSQGAIDLRQVLEAGAAAAFAIANPEMEHFANVDAQGLLDPTQALTRTRYQWLEANYRSKSDWIKEKKEQINLSTAHANVVSTETVFRVTDAGDTVNAPFFDVEDEYMVKADLWMMGSIALTMVDFFYGVNQGQNVIEFCPDFAGHVQQTAQENEALLTELKSTDRFKRALAKFGTPTS
jgi:hypothetical protein